MNTRLRRRHRAALLSAHVPSVLARVGGYTPAVLHLARQESKGVEKVEIVSHRGAGCGLHKFTGVVGEASGASV